jgi:hypothetical protein
MDAMLAINIVFSKLCTIIFKLISDSETSSLTPAVFQFVAILTAAQTTSENS